MSYQSVTLCGHMGQDPEIKSFQNGGKIANLSIATSRRWKDKQTGDVREKTEWHRVSVRNDALVALLADYTRKGSAILVVGELETRKWQDQSGNDRYTTEIVVAGYNGVVRLLDSRERTGQTQNRDRGGSSGGGYDSSPGGNDGVSSGGAGQGSRSLDIDDEIPF